MFTLQVLRLQKFTIVQYGLPRTAAHRIGHPPFKAFAMCFKIRYIFFLPLDRRRKVSGKGI